MNFPLFRLVPKRDFFKIKQYDGLLELDGKVIDNKNLPESTLGKRRLRLPANTLYPLRTMFSTLQQVIKHKNSVFIDNTGKLIMLRYDKYHTIISRRIKETRMVGRNSYYLRIETVPYWIYFSNYVNTIDTPWANLISLPRGYVIYSITEEPTNRTRIML